MNDRCPPTTNIPGIGALATVFKIILLLAAAAFCVFALFSVCTILAAINMESGWDESYPAPSPRDTLPPGKPQWTPDGASIVFGHDGDIYAVNQDDASSLSLVYAKGGELDIRSAPRMLLAGSRLAYEKYEHSRLVFFTRHEWRAATAALDGADERVVKADGRGFSWSPDNSRLAFIGRNREGEEEMRLTDADGSNSRTVFEYTYMDGSPTRYPGSPNGYPGASAGFPVWSPDGGRIAFVIKFDHSFHRLYTVGADGSGLVVVAKGKQGELMSSPAWSPDGSRIAFMSATRAPDDDSPWKLPTLYSTHTVSPDGSNPAALHQTVNAHESGFDTNQVAWSPDGAKLLVAVANSVHAVNADGSGSRALINFPPNEVFAINAGYLSMSRNARASWSPDGSKIAVYSRGSEGVLITMSADGSDKRVLARKGIPLRPAADQTWRPEYDAPTPAPAMETANP